MYRGASRGHVLQPRPARQGARAGAGAAAASRSSIRRWSSASRPSTPRRARRSAGALGPHAPARARQREAAASAGRPALPDRRDARRRRARIPTPSWSSAAPARSSTSCRRRPSALGVAGHVTFAGLVDNEIVADYNRAADVFVLPSLLEALPTVAVEALACGTPVVSADHPGGVELHALFGDDVAVVAAGGQRAAGGRPGRAPGGSAPHARRHCRRPRAALPSRRGADAVLRALRLARAHPRGAARGRGRRVIADARLWRGLGGAAAGALAAGLSLCLVYVIRPAFTASLDTTPNIIRGLYPTEHEPGGLSFAWTRDRVTLTFDGLDRSTPWTLVLRAKAGRGPGLPAAAGDDRHRRRPPGNRDDRERLAGRARRAAGGRRRPARPSDARDAERRADLRAGPGRRADARADPRRCAADARRAACRGCRGGRWSPRPSPAGSSARPSADSACRWCGRSASRWPSRSPRRSRWRPAGRHTPVPTSRSSRGSPATSRSRSPGSAAPSAMIRRDGLSETAATAIAISIVALVLELEGLLHPSKALVDAVFHAHRLDTVLEGRYFFTQPMPSGVEFPYAIGLYVTAMPWAGLPAITCCCCAGGGGRPRARRARALPARACAAGATPVPRWSPSPPTCWRRCRSS